MKILLLSDPNSSHTIKWAKSLADHDLNILIFGLSHFNVNYYDSYKNINVISLKQHIAGNEGTPSKLKYLKALPIVKSLIKEFKPDIVHAHYATSYGLLGTLSGFHPYMLSVWGSDVFSFPKISFLHRFILKYNLRKADKILSTSHAMANETKLYTNKDIEVTPFGIDLEQFRPKVVDSIFDDNDIVIGTIKTLEKIYGIEYLIRAFKIVHNKYQSLSLKLLIVGSGNLEEELKLLVRELDIERQTVFIGKVAYNEVSKYHNMLSVYVSISISESFGVAVIEASACCKPVIVSNVGGLPEVVENEVTGLIVPPCNPEETAEAIEKLIFDEKLKDSFGKAGRERVKKLYNWDDNVKQMLEIYSEICSKEGKFDD